MEGGHGLQSSQVRINQGRVGGIRPPPGLEEAREMMKMMMMRETISRTPLGCRFYYPSCFTKERAKAWAG